ALFAVDDYRWRDLLLDRRVRCAFVRPGREDREPDRPRLDDGVHAPAVERAADSRRVRAGPGAERRVVAAAQRAVANGRADEELVRDGDRAAGRASGRRERDVG